MIAKFKQPDYNDAGQSGTGYPLAIDAASAVLAELAAQFAVSAQDTPNLTVAMRAGRIYQGNRVIVERAAQNSAALIAPIVNPRHDIIYIGDSGVLGVATGVESATPVDPALIATVIPIARIRWTVGATQITNSMFDDLRPSPASIDQVMQYIYSNIIWSIGNGGTGANTAADARANLGAETAGAAAAVAAAAVMDDDVAGGVLGGTFPNPSFAVDMATQAELNAIATDRLGVGQTWRDQSLLTGGRAAGTVYQNTTGRSIQVSVFINIPPPGNGGQTATFYEDVNADPTGNVIASLGAGGQGVDRQFWVWAIIPNLHYYKLTGNAATSWKELRDQA